MHKVQDPVRKQKIGHTVFAFPGSSNSLRASKQRLVFNHLHENELHFNMNEISFSYEKKGTKTRLEKEAKANSETHEQN